MPRLWVRFQGRVEVTKYCYSGVLIGLCVVVREEVNKVFSDGGCVRVICNIKRGGADYISEGMQGRSVVTMIWCPLVGGKWGHNGSNVRAGRYGEPVKLINPQIDWKVVFCLGRSGSSGSVLGMDLMGQPERYGVMRGTWLHSLRPKREAVCSDNDFWETWTGRFPSGLQFHSKDDPRKNSTFPMKSVANFSIRNFLKQDSYAFDSEKGKSSQRRDWCGWDVWEF